MPRQLPGTHEQTYLVYAGTGTDLLFNRGIDLPGFASFPLLRNPETRGILAQQMQDLVDLSGRHGMGCILDTPTWMANRDRAAQVGTPAEDISAINRDAVALMDAVRQGSGRDDVLVSACVGPRHDPHGGAAPMAVSEAQDYHMEQLAALIGTAVDLVIAYTFNKPDEAAGCVLAAKALGLPIIVSFVVETDGKLDDGTPLDGAIARVDTATDAAPLFYMVNCAHPSHFSSVLTGHPRLRGAIANASKCSHAELDGSETLDDGDPNALGREIAELVRQSPALCVLGGCCGTDMRHLDRIAEEVKAL